MATPRSFHSKFKGDPDDYLKWFKFGYEQSNQVKLPGETLSRYKLEYANDIFKNIEGNKEQNSSYANSFVDDHNKKYENSLKYGNQLPAFSHPKFNHEFEDISSLADTECDEIYSNQEADAARTLVYTRYDFTKKNEDALKLPVNNMKKEILQKIERYSVVVIQGYTGCGKSTQIPQFILDEGADKHQHVNILVTQPRKIAAISLASRVCEERGWRKNNSIVGYQVGLNSVVSIDTRLTYATTEVLIQKAIHKKTLSDYTHIILDEIHERDEHTDFALLVVKKLLHTICRNLKVILMSATIDCEKFANYFATPISGHLIPAPIIPIEDKGSHSIHIFYLESLSKAFRDKMPAYDPHKPGITKEMFKLSVDLISRFDDIENGEGKDLCNSNNFPDKRGAVLMFLPGLHEIESVMELLRNESPTKQYELFPLHSSLTLEEQRDAFKEVNVGFRKVIVSTNIAESSITVPDIKYVIDFCLTKELHCDPLTNFTSLKMVWSSKASCTQRAGRAGRVSSGRVFRLIEEHFYDDLNDHSTPELSRIPLSQAILKIKMLDMGEPKAMLALALDPPNLGNIRRTILILKQIGALGMKSGGSVSSLDGDLTYLGHIAASLPLDPKLSKLIVMGYIFGCLKECIIIAAGLSLKSFHSTPYQDEMNAYLCKISWSYGSFSDCLAIYNTYYVWDTFSKKGLFPGSNKKKEREWARTSYVQLEALKEVQKLVDELTSRLTNLKLDKNKSNFMKQRFKEPELCRKDKQTFFLKLCIAGAFYPNYFKQSKPDDYENVIGRELSGNDPLSTLVVSGLPPETNILYEDQIRKIFRECSTNLDISYEGSKAYIGFPEKMINKTHSESERNKELPSNFRQAMHIALKMKHVKRIRETLKLDTYSNQEAIERMALASKDSDPSKSLRRIVKNASKDLEPPQIPEPSVNVWSLEVVHVESPSRFWVASSTGYKLNEAREVILSIEAAKKKGLVPLPKKNLKSKRFCLAPYTDPIDGTEGYFRARIEEIESDMSLNKVLVYFVDFGNTEEVDCSTLKEMPNDVYKIPMQAIQCSLSNVKPASLNRGQAVNEWTKEVIDWFEANTLCRKFIGKIYSVVHNVVRLELLKDYEKDGTGPRESVNELLVSKKFALRAEEFLLSKRNHELRAVFTSSKHKYSLGQKSFLNKGVTDFFNHNSTSDESSSNCYLGTKYLNGPHSPLEMKFVALTKTGTTKNVRVDSASVNSTALDLDPLNKNEKFMVSPIVALNPSESTILLRSSTLMPAYPGMLGLCLMIFGPCVEMRLNEQGNGYSGVICGLGFDPQTGSAIYPDDDIELAFDCEITNEDLCKVNGLRYLMSSSIEYLEITPVELANYQNTMRKLVLQIFDDKRKPLTLEYFPRAYKWNQVCDRDILYPEIEEEFKENKKIVWILHQGICLKNSENNASALSICAKRLKRLWRRLKDERRPDNYPIDEVCCLCDNKKLQTYMELESHILLKYHRQKEQLIYGC